MSKKTILITTPIYYPNGSLHIGHLFTTSLVWAIRNYKRLKGFDAVMLTGADEHGQKIFNTAIANKMLPQKFVDLQADNFKKLWELAKIDTDFFVRTSDFHHFKAVKRIFTDMFNKGYIYKGFYKGLYSISDEEFVTKTNAIEKDGKFYHPISDHELVEISDESYFFKLDKLKDFLIDEFLNLDHITSEAIIKEMKANFLSEGLEDLSVTRIKIDWGIPIVEDSQHIIYVWLDALFSYLTSLGFYSKDDSLFKKYWENATERINVVGKEITRFHCIYWPIFLKSLEVKIPTKIVTHGWIITPTGKMSKSKNNVVDPVTLIDKFSAELVKFFIVTKISIRKDSIFSEELLANAVNTELVNVFGNLISRSEKMSENNFTRTLAYKKVDELEKYYELIDSLETKFSKHADEFNFDLGYEEVLKLGNELNLIIDKYELWKLKADNELLEQILLLIFNGIYAMAAMYQILLPEKIATLAKNWNLKSFEFEKISKRDKFKKHIFRKNENLFTRLK
ncbi:methionine--tRNA ligase [Mycoplasmopsis agassizii]|uniref:methionine--tRNA ligase n=1 Tax=Mycoplasmopsis agassizii TaxID=33922 RepID=UPI003527AB02